MKRYDERWTRSDIVREATLWAWWPQGAVALEDERRLLVHMPSHWDKSVVWRSAVNDEERAGELIEETISEVRTAGGTRLVWHTGDATRPENMHELLKERGFERTQQLEVLAFELGDGPKARLPRLDAPADITTMLARDAGALREMHRVSSQVFSSAEPSDEEIAEYVKELEKLEQREKIGASNDGGSLTLRFLASLRESDRRQVVASAGLQVVGETGRLWGGGTLAPFRGRGAYRALVVARCRTAHALGATLALVKADIGTAGPILRRAGFRVAGTERRHVLRIPGNDQDC